MEEVGVGQCDMVITVCGVWLLSYFFSDDKVEPVDCSSQCVFYQGWILTPARLKAKLRDRGWGGSGGRGTRLGGIVKLV